MGFSTYAEYASLNEVFEGEKWLALYTTLPSKADTGGVELSGGGYTRASITFISTLTNEITHATIVSFPEATVNWTDVVGFGIRTASSGGTLLATHEFTAPITITAGMTLRFGVGNIVVGYEV